MHRSITLFDLQLDAQNLYIKLEIKQGYITMFTRVCYLSNRSPHIISRKFILVLSSHLLLGLWSGLFPSGLPTKTLYVPLPFPTRAIFTAHLILIDFITRKTISYRASQSSLSCSLLLSSLILHFLGTKIFLSSLFPNAVNLCFCLNVRGQFSQPH